MLPRMRTLPFLVLLLALAACAHAAPRADTQPTVPEVDTRCRVDADCVVKDVGNCCGHYPACVHRDSPTFPDLVKADCERRGIAGVCGFPVIKGCACVDGRCAAAEHTPGVVR
ncbi:MAG: hypothetical protein EOP90_09615 [Lysobacteraceae bacterium]|nr:MAG: hypothetical protein EOP90_09615 [Xanthomonadaceae bacterium]